MKARTFQKTAVATLAALSLLVVGASDTGRSTASQEGTNVTAANAPPPPAEASTNAQPIQVVKPAQVNLPPELAEVVRLAESGVQENVILTYIEKSAVPYAVTADQVVYLRDVGVSPAVLKALVEHSPKGPGTVGESVTGEAAADAAAQQPSAPAPESTATQANAPPADAAQPQAEANATQVPAPPTVTNNEFYEPLAPYGSWLDLPNYGWCWQPTVVVVNPFWRPYCDDGYWLWSDCGWYWSSDRPTLHPSPAGRLRRLGARIIPAWRLTAEARGEATVATPVAGDPTDGLW